MGTAQVSSRHTTCAVDMHVYHHMHMHTEFQVDVLIVLADVLICK